MGLYTDDRQNLKDSVARVIADGGQGKQCRKRFKKAVAKSIAKHSTAPLIKMQDQIAESSMMIEELWKEVVSEQV